MKTPKTKKSGGKRKRFLSLRLPEELESALDLYCSGHNIKSKSDLVREAVMYYVEPDVKDETLRLIGIKDMQIKLQKVIDGQQVIFKFLFTLYKNILAYLPEIPEQLKQEAALSAGKRFDSFYAAFQRNLENDVSFFESILHKYYSGDENG